MNRKREFKELEGKTLTKITSKQGDDVGDPIYRFKDVPQGKYKVIIKRQYKYGEETKVID